MSASADLKSKGEKDAELDKRIEALRRKNQALIKRYQEIEEDRRKAEQEGVAVTGARRGLPPPAAAAAAQAPPVLERRPREMAALTVQILLSPEEKRVVSNEPKPRLSHKAFRGNPTARGSGRGGGSLSGGVSPAADRRPEQSGWEGTDEDSTGGIGKRGRGGQRTRGGRGRGGPAADGGPDRRSKEWEERRRQNIEKMNEEMEKIAEYERSQRDGLQERNPVRNFLDDPRRSGPFTDSSRREGSRRHIRNWGGADFDKVKTGMEQGKGQTGAHHREEMLDMTLSMTGRERAEYIRWKQEREQIDRERLARHRQATGEWRREWDAEKMDTIFKEGAKPGGSRGNKHDEFKRPPKIPTLGAFLPEHQPQRRRKGRGRGHSRGSLSKPYSMHDNRWEKEEGPEAAPSEVKSVAALVQQVELAALPHTAPDEDEDQWEDVSEGEEEEEEEEEGNISQRAFSVTEEEAPASSSPQNNLAKLPGQDGPLLLAIPSSEQETSDMALGKPLTPFSPAEGYFPVSDWGEEMEMSSPRNSCTKSPLTSLADVASVPPLGALAEESAEGLCTSKLEEVAASKPGEQGTVLESAQCLVPSCTAEIPDSLQEKAQE